MELRHYLSIMRQRLALIIVTVVVAIAAAWAATPRTAVYSANSTLVVGPRQFSVDSSSGDLSGDRATGLERLARTFASMIDSEPLAQSALDLTNAPRSAASVVAETSAAPVTGTQLLRISVSDPDPAVAQSLADGLADAFITQVENYDAEAPAAEGSVPSVPVYIFERAKLPTVPRPLGLVRNLTVAALFGFLAAVAVVFLLEYLDVTVKGSEDAERRLGLPVLGVIPLYRQTSRLDVPPARRGRRGAASRPQSA